MSLNLKTFEPKKILVCQLRQIGDVVISTSCIELLRKRYPDAEIHLLTEQKCAPLVRHNPAIHTIWEVKPKAGLMESLRFYYQAGANNYDLVVDFQRLPRCRWTLLFSRARVKLTGPSEWYQKFFYTHFGGRSKGGYAGSMKASVLEPLGIEWNQEKPRVYLTDQEREWARSYLRSQGFEQGQTLVTVDPTHRRKTRCWMPLHYAELLRRAAQERDDLKFYLLYGPGERQVVDAIIKYSEIPDRIILPPEDHEPDLREMAAIVGESALHFGNCSAPRHVAVALDVPTLTIIGSNGPTAWTFPAPEHETAFIRLDCHKCNKEECPKGTLACLRELTPDMVLPQFLNKLPERG
ncbi:MAG: glycosyltransferase family 9 protein [Desulfovibrionaceae bacterium]